MITTLPGRASDSAVATTYKAASAARTSGAPTQSAQRRPGLGTGASLGCEAVLAGRTIGELRIARRAPVRSSERSNSIALGVAAGVLICCVAAGVALGAEISGAGGGTEGGLTTTRGEGGASCELYLSGASTSVDVSSSSPNETETPAAPCEFSASAACRAANAFSASTSAASSIFMVGSSCESGASGAGPGSGVTPLGGVGGEARVSWSGRMRNCCVGSLEAASIALSSAGPGNASIGVTPKSLGRIFGIFRRGSEGVTSLTSCSTSSQPRSRVCSFSQSWPNSSRIHSASWREP